MKAIVLGATGLVGSKLIGLLIADSAFTEIISIGRSAPQQEHPKLKVIQKDFLEWKQDDFQGDILFCCLGTTIKKARSKENFRHVDYEMPLRAAEYFRGHFILISSIGADEKSNIFYGRTKGELERDIKKLNRKFSIVRPSILLGKRRESRPAEYFAQKILPFGNFLLQGRLKKYRPVDAEEVAKCMISLSQNASARNYFIETIHMNV